MASKCIPLSTPPNISPITRLPNLPPVSKSPVTSKKKESKNEKSLETTLEKLTQNRHKELSSKSETTEGIKANTGDTVKSESGEKAITKICHTDLSQPSSSHTCTSVNKTPVHLSDKEGITSKIPDLEMKKEPTSTIKLPPPNASQNLKLTVGTNILEKNDPTKSLPTADPKSESPPRTITNDSDRSELNDTVETSQCTETNKYESSGSKSADINDGLSDNKNSEKIVEGGE